MVILKEETSRYKELVQTLVPLVYSYAKPISTPKAILDMVNRFAAVLEKWDYSSKEIKNLDRRAFMDMVRTWQSEASAQDIASIKAVI